MPIVFVDRIYGSSKLGSNEVYSYLLGVWKLFWKLWSKISLIILNKNKKPNLKQFQFK